MYLVFRPSNSAIFPQMTRFGAPLKNFKAASFRAQKMKGQVKNERNEVLLDYTDEGNVYALSASNMNYIEEFVS